MASESQRKANKNQDLARKDQPRYTLRMTGEEADLLKMLEKLHGSKKDAIIKGLNLLRDTSKAPKV